MKAQIPLLTLLLIGLLARNAAAVTRHVDLNSPSPTPPYTSWSTAATNIQDAIDAAVSGDLVLVTNGVYRTGGKVVIGALTNRVAIDKPITVRSVSGPAVTVIEGYTVPVTTFGDSAIRCVFLASNAVISGFTLTNGATHSSESSVFERIGGGVGRGLLGRSAATLRPMPLLRIALSLATLPIGAVAVGVLSYCRIAC